MLCQNCNQNAATMHFKQTINGQTKEMHLCPACAHKMGVEQSFQQSLEHSLSSFGSWFAEDPFFSHPFGMLSQPFAQTAQIGSGRRCKTCGMTESELQRTGRAGCADCYGLFEDILTPYIRKLQGATAHVGPAPTPQADTQQDPTISLRSKLEQAVQQENYEEAARLRDEIRRLEGENHA